MSNKFPMMMQLIVIADMNVDTYRKKLGYMHWQILTWVQADTNRMSVDSDKDSANTKGKHTDTDLDIF